MAALRMALWILRVPNAGLGNRPASSPASLALSICTKCNTCSSVIPKSKLFGASLAYFVFVVLDGVALCPRRVDDEVHLLVQDDIENVRAALSKTLQARVEGKLACT
mgnify:CR=1 FL=1